MSNFDQMLHSIREDCGDTTLADAYDLRRVGSHRTVVHRAVGGAATLVVIAGVTTGVVLLGSTTPATTTGPATSGGTATATATTAPLTPSAAPTTAKATPPAPPLTSPTEQATKPTPACVDTSFNTAHPTIVGDSAAGTIGFDIRLKYTGAAACILSQPPRVYYTTVNGETLPFGIDSAHSHPRSAKPITVRPGRTVYVTVYGQDGQNYSPVPPNCTSPHLYKGLAVAIDGKIIGLLHGTMQFPCSGPVSMTWQLLN